MPVSSFAEETLSWLQEPIYLPEMRDVAPDKVFTVRFNQDIEGSNINVVDHEERPQNVLFAMGEQKNELLIVPQRNYPVGEYEIRVNHYMSTSGKKLFRPVHMKFTVSQASEPSDSDYVFDKSTGTILEYLGSQTEVHIPRMIQGVEVRVIGERAFVHKELTGLILPDSVVEIGQYAFAYNKIDSLKIPDSVRKINTAAFIKNRLKSLDLGNSVESIGKFAFSDNELTSLRLPPSTKIVSGFGENQLESVDLGNVEEIGDSAFSENKLKTLVIPSSVKRIGRQAFSGNELTSVKILEGLSVIGLTAFSGNPLT